MRQLKRQRIINQRQHDNKLRNELIRGEQMIHDRHFQAENRRNMPRGGHDSIQAKVDKFLDRKRVDVKTNNPAQDAALLEENRLNGNQADQLFENLIQRISGGKSGHMNTDFYLELPCPDKGPGTEVDRSKVDSQYAKSALGDLTGKSPEEGTKNGGINTSLPTNINETNGNDSAYQSRRNISRQNKSRRDMLQNISKS